MSEIPLAGGNASAQVVLVDGTVRKPWLTSTPSAQRYARHLLAHGVDLPRPCGRDAQGRQRNEYVEGTLAMDGPELTLEELAHVGRMVRAIHVASSSFVQNPSDSWERLIPAPGQDLVCHNDLAPWNLVVGDRWVFIDWDASAPSTLEWDLAYAAQTFTLNNPAAAPEECAARLRAFVDGYAASADLRAALPQTMWSRAKAMHDMLRRAHATGREPWGTMFESGHGKHWSDVSRFVRQHEEVWREALRTT